jgi:hypothetical protein
MKPSASRHPLEVERQRVQFRMYQQDFMDAMDEYLNKLTHREMYDMIYEFWFDWILEHRDVEFVEKFIKSKEL